jgi:hypothetical protein
MLVEPSMSPKKDVKPWRAARAGFVSEALTEIIVPLPPPEATGQGVASRFGTLGQGCCAGSVTTIAAAREVLWLELLELRCAGGT